MAKTALGKAPLIKAFRHQRPGCSPASVTVTSLRTAVFDRRLLDAVSA